MKKNIILNRVAWTFGTNSNIMNFAETIAKRILWNEPNTYPFNCNLNSNRIELTIDKDYYIADIKKFFKTFDFPKTTMIDSIQLNIKEKKDLAITGCIGCITLVGWIILPYYKTDTEISIEVNISYLDKTGIKNKKIIETAKISEYFHLLNNENTIFKNTSIQIEKIKSILKEKIEKDTKLFIKENKKII